MRVLLLICTFIGYLAAQDQPPTFPLFPYTNSVEHKKLAAQASEELCKDTFPRIRCMKYKSRGYCKFRQIFSKCRQSCEKCPGLLNERYRGKCGIPAVPLRYLFSSRIIGGQDAKPGSIPWQALIYLSSSSYRFCGGTLIDHFHIITVAHCFLRYKEPYHYHVIVGRNSMNSDVGSKRLEIAEIIQHPGYSYTTDTEQMLYMHEYPHEHDIAIVKLAKYLPFDKFIRPVCLPEPNLKLYPGRNALVSGFGVMNLRNENAKTLQQVDVKIIQKKQCQKWFWKRLGYRILITQNMLCAGHAEGGKDSCMADNGGALVVEEGGQHILAGIVSWGLGCGKPRLPGIYVKVKNYVDWIETNTY